MRKIKFKYLHFIILIFCTFGVFNSVSQVVFYQDICNCGVTGAGGTLGANPGQVNFDVFVEPNSSIKKAFLLIGADGVPESINLNLNGINHSINQNLLTTSGFLSLFSTGTFNSGIYVKDITSDINPSISNYNLTIPIQNYSGLNVFSTYYLLIIYENNLLSTVATNIILNYTSVSSQINYTLIDLLPISTNNDVGLSTVGWHFCDIVQDGSYISVNGNNVGLIGGNDENSTSFCTGVQGHFYYQNNEFYGLSDDIANSVMSGSDAIANIQSFLSNNTTTMNLDFNYQSPDWEDGSKSNPILGVFLTYTTPCSEFHTQTSTDTTLCQGTTAQLFASGGTSTGSAPAYSWQPATGLSCTDCPNPIVTADSSRLYTVRIWNNDSCSVVRPIKVNVQPLPQFSGVGSTPTACGENTGSAIAVAQNTTPLPLSYSINGAPFAFISTYTGNFANLSAGANTIILRDAFGCETDTVIQIGVTNTTNAFFTATPNSGAAPLSVSFTNQSTNATNYNWFIESDFVGDNLLQHTFDTSGNYTVTLIAWQNDPLCADTFSIQILVYDSLIIQIPNVFTPNGDGINDQFTITTNQPVSVEYHLFNRWGNVIAQDTKATTAGSSNFVLSIWDGAGYSDGTYFYVIRVVHDGKEYEFDGFLERIE